MEKSEKEKNVISYVMPKGNRRLTKGTLCPYYHGIEEMSVRCGNCHWNRYINGEPTIQVCLPHTIQEAIKRGTPNLSYKKVIQ